jgi:hypothetical protein
MFPFQLPWDDASESVTNISWLNDKPAGRDGFVHVKDGHLFAGEKRLRIFGVNTCFAANFPDKSMAPKVAARMAKFGINCVRFHHMDMMSAPGGIFAKDGRTLDLGQLDKLDFFIAELKKNGIYADLNLHVSRTYPDRPRAEKKGNPDYDKGVDNYCAAMIALQKDYARDLLTHVNAYTGNRYADEPAVALVEINNENALGFQWWAGEMDDLPAPYREELESLWAAWILKKHGSDEAARKAWSAGAEPLGAELIDSDFDKKDTAWTLEKHGDAQADGRVGIVPDDFVQKTFGAATHNGWNKPGNAVSTMTVGVAKTGTEPWHVQFHHAKLNVESGRTYTLSFFAKSDAARKISVNVGQTHEPWRVLWSTQASLTTEWKHFAFSFRPSEGDKSAGLPNLRAVHKHTRIGCPRRVAADSTRVACSTRERPLAAVAIMLHHPSRSPQYDPHPEMRPDGRDVEFCADNPPAVLRVKIRSTRPRIAPEDRRAIFPRRSHARIEQRLAKPRAAHLRQRGHAAELECGRHARLRCDFFRIRHEIDRGDADEPVADECTEVERARRIIAIEDRRFARKARTQHGPAHGDRLGCGDGADWHHYFRPRLRHPMVWRIHHFPKRIHRIRYATKSSSKTA